MRGLVKYKSERGNYRQKDQYEQKHRDDETGMCQVTRKANVARTIYTNIEVVGEKAGEMGHCQIRRAWALSIAKREPKE